MLNVSRYLIISLCLASPLATPLSAASNFLQHREYWELQDYLKVYRDLVSHGKFSLAQNIFDESLMLLRNCLIENPSAKNLVIFQHIEAMLVTCSGLKDQIFYYQQKLQTPLTSEKKKQVEAFLSTDLESIKFTADLMVQVSSALSS